ncbi:MAG TPA: hypothetical protein V6C76_13650 [Drouetiella sp.]
MVLNRKNKGIITLGLIATAMAAGGVAYALTGSMPFVPKATSFVPKTNAVSMPSVHRATNTYKGMGGCG